MDYPKEYPRMLAVGAVVVSEEGRVLLHRRENDPDKGKWQIFGTYVKPAEQLVDAVRRRLKEDGGISDVKSIEFTGRYYDRPERHVNSYCVPFVFKVVISKDAVINTSSCAWFSSAEAKKLQLALDNSEIIADIL